MAASSVCEEYDCLKPVYVCCSECKKQFCEICGLNHSFVQSFQSHLVVPIENLPSQCASYANHAYCSDHKRNYQMFCLVHGVPLCASCIDRHSDCKGITPLPNVISNVNLSRQLSFLQKRLTDIEKNASTLQEIQEKTLKTDCDENNIVLSNIRQIRKTIVTQLDEIEGNLEIGIEKHNKTKRERVKATLITLGQEKTKARDFCKQLEILKRSGSDIQIFLGMRKFSENASTAETLLQTLNISENKEKIPLGHYVDGNLTRLTSDLEKIGHILLEKTCCPVTLDNNAQYVETKTETQSIFEIELTHCQTINTTSHHTCGFDVLPDGNMVFGDVFKQQLLVNDCNGKHLYKVSISPNSPFEVATIDNSTVAVTSSIFKVVIIVDLRNRLVKKRINIGHSCFGVTHREGALLVCAAGHGIVSVNLTNEKITTIVQCDLPLYSYISCCNDKLYYTGNELQTVNCCDMTGCIIWTFRDSKVLMNTRGISVDDGGRVFVVDFKKEEVIVLSNDGLHSKLLLSKQNDVMDPFAVSVDRTRKRLVVANVDGTAYVYDLLN